MEQNLPQKAEIRESRLQTVRRCSLPDCCRTNPPLQMQTRSDHRMPAPKHHHQMPGSTWPRRQDCSVRTMKVPMPQTSSSRMHPPNFARKVMETIRMLGWDSPDQMLVHSHHQMQNRSDRTCLSQMRASNSAQKQQSEYWGFQRRASRQTDSGWKLTRKGWERLLPRRPNFQTQMD